MKRWNVNSPIEYEDREGNKKTQWLRCGSAFENRDGSITVRLETLPLNGKVLLQEPRAENDRDANRGSR